MCFLSERQISSLTFRSDTESAPQFGLNYFRLEEASENASELPLQTTAASEQGGGTLSGFYNIKVRVVVYRTKRFLHMFFHLLTLNLTTHNGKVP